MVSVRRLKEEPFGARRRAAPLSGHSRWARHRPLSRATSWFAAAAARSRLFSESSDCRTAADGRARSPLQDFWAALMVLTTALPAREVQRFELSEDSITSHTDVSGSLKFCPAGIGGRASNAGAQEWPAQLYNHLKEGALRWGDVSIFTRAPLHTRASVPACAR